MFGAYDANDLMNWLELFTMPWRQLARTIIFENDPQPLRSSDGLARVVAFHKRSDELGSSFSV